MASADDKSSMKDMLPTSYAEEAGESSAAFVRFMHSIKAVDDPSAPAELLNGENEPANPGLMKEKEAVSSGLMKSSGPTDSESMKEKEPAGSGLIKEKEFADPGPMPENGSADSVLMKGSEPADSRKPVSWNDETGPLDEETCFNDIVCADVDDEKTTAPDDDKKIRMHLLDEEQKEFARIKDGHIESQLSQDTTSFIITAHVWSGPFYIGLGMCIVKIAVFSLAFENALKKPYAIAVTASVAWVQVLSLFFAALLQDDVANGVKLVSEGYDCVQGHFNGAAAKGKWFIAVVFAFCNGLIGLATIFELTTQSRTVLDVLLNFAAISFISRLDDSTFVLCTLGFLGEACKTETEKVSGTVCRVRHNQQFGYYKKVTLLTITFLTMLIPWIKIAVDQQSGAFVPNRMIAQFDDAVLPFLSTYSGEYRLDDTGAVFSNDLFHWSSAASNIFPTRPTGMFGYCVGRWTYTFGEDPCPMPILESISPAELFDFFRASKLPWYVNQNRISYKMENLVLVPTCQEDSIHTCVHGKCAVQRLQQFGVCECTDDSYGVRCQHLVSETCPQLVVDERFDELPASRKLAEVYTLLLSKEAQENGKTVATSRDDIVLVYDHPVYVGNSTGQKGVDVIFYSGLRWAVTGSLHGFVDHRFDSDTRETLELAEFLTAGSFHANFSVHTVDLLSEKVGFQTLTDTGSPVGIPWAPLVEQAHIAEVEFEVTRGSSEALLCAECHNTTNHCKNEGYCSPKDRRCDCQYRTKGVLCQVAPIADGVCDSTFNTPAFQYDGGDCCEETCSSGDSIESTCGLLVATVPTNDGGIRNNNISNELVDPSGKQISSFVGFPECGDTEVLEGCETSDLLDPNSSRGCWARSTTSLRDIFEPDEAAGYRMSSNGRILLAYQEDSGRLEVYDRNMDFGWIRRGNDILGSSNVFEFILRSQQPGRKHLMTLDTLPFQIFDSYASEIPVWVAFIANAPFSDGDVSVSNAIAAFFEWDREEKRWEKFAEDLNLTFEGNDDCSGEIIDMYLDVRLVNGQGRMEASFTVWTHEAATVYELNRTIVKSFDFSRNYAVDMAEGSAVDNCNDHVVDINSAVGIQARKIGNETFWQVLDLGSGNWSEQIKIEECQTFHNIFLSDGSTQDALSGTVHCTNDRESTIRTVQLLRDETVGIYSLETRAMFRLNLDDESISHVALSPTRVAYAEKGCEGGDCTKPLGKITVLAYENISGTFQLGSTIYHPGGAENLELSSDGTSVLVQGATPMVYSLPSACKIRVDLSLILTISTGLFDEFVTWNASAFYTDSREAISTKGNVSTLDLEPETMIREELCFPSRGLISRIIFYLGGSSAKRRSYEISSNGISLQGGVFEDKLPEGYDDLPEEEKDRLKGWFRTNQSEAAEIWMDDITKAEMRGA